VSGSGTVSRNPSTGSLAPTNPNTSGTARHIRFDIGIPGQLFPNAPTVSGVGSVIHTGAKIGSGNLVAGDPVISGDSTHDLVSLDGILQTDFPGIVGFAFVGQSDNPYTFAGFMPSSPYGDTGFLHLTYEGQEQNTLATLGGFVGFDISTPYGDVPSLHLTYEGQLTGAVIVGGFRFTLVNGQQFDVSGTTQVLLTTYNSNGDIFHSMQAINLTLVGSYIQMLYEPTSGMYYPAPNYPVQPTLPISEQRPLLLSNVSSFTLVKVVSGVAYASDYARIALPNSIF
jgi:hypothetical protein